MTKILKRSVFLNGFLRRVVRPAQRQIYARMMKAKVARSDKEIEAVAPFESRAVTQHAPIEGLDGFLFHRDHDALDQLSATVVLRQRQIDVWMDALRARRAWCAANGRTMRVMVIPEKHVVYREKLPRVQLSPHRAAMQLLEAADGELGAQILYPLNALRLASKIKPTFFKTDTHWNGYGAFVAYRTLIESLATEFPLESVREEELIWKERPFVGDLGVRYTDEHGETIEYAEPTSTYKLVFQNHRFDRGAVHIYENERRDLPTCVLYRDSFSNFLIPYLMRGFSRLVAVSSISCHYDLLDQEKPDVVLFAIIERFIATFWTGTTIQLPEDEAGMSFEAFSGTELQALASTEG